MKALILDNKVHQVVPDGNEFPVHESMKWIDCAPEVQPGWVLINNVLQKDPTVIAQRKRQESPEEKYKREMPSVQEQLDDLWQAMDDGVLPKNNAFYQKRRVLKNKYKVV